MTQTKPVTTIAYIYTQHDVTAKLITEMCNAVAIRLQQDRTKDPATDVLSQIPAPYAVIPLPYYDERFIEGYKQKGARIWLMEFGNKLLAVANVPPETESYEYTALPREVALQIEERAPWVKMKTLTFDNRPITVIEGYVPIILYAVLPVDKAIELKQRAPWLKLRLLQLDGKIVEKLTARPYDPKSEYPIEVLQQALKIFEVKGGKIRYYSVNDFLRELDGKRVAVFNDTLREALHVLVANAKVSVELVKTCNSECVEINPLGIKSGIRISFPGTAGKLTAEQMAEMIVRGETRVYYAEVQTTQTSLCP